jgi:hypothetical protein
MNDDPWNFVVRTVYDESGRTFALDFNQRYSVEVDHMGFASLGGLAVVVEGGDGVRSCHIGFGFEKFTKTFCEAVSRFCKLDVSYEGVGETASERLEDRNEFLRKASTQYPAILAEINRTLHSLRAEVEEASGRFATIRTKQ